MAIFFVGASPGCTISTQVRYVNVGASPGCTISTQVHYIFSVQERGTLTPLGMHLWCLKSF